MGEVDDGKPPSISGIPSPPPTETIPRRPPSGGKGNHHDTKPRVWPGDIDDGPPFTKLSRPATD